MNVDEKVDQLEAVTDPNTVISIGGYAFTPAKLMIAGGILSTVLGGLYGAFEVYKDYQQMKEQIAAYVTPDLTGLQEQLSVMKKEMVNVKESVSNGVDYTNEIKNDLRQDIRRIESVVDSVEVSTKATERELSSEMRSLRKDAEVTQRNLSKEVDARIQKALDNPLGK